MSERVLRAAWLSSTGLLTVAFVTLLTVQAVQARSNDPAPAPPADPPPLTPEALPGRAVVVTNCDALDKVHMQATEKWIGDKPSDRETEVSKVIFYKSVELDQTVEHNGKPLGRWSRSREASEVRHDEQLIDRRWRGPKDNGHLVNIADEIWAVPDLLRNFQWTREGAGEIDGHPATIFRYSPKPGIHPGSRIERALSAMYGRAWVDPASGQVMRVEFKNRQPLKFGWGLLANFSSISGTLEMQPVTVRDTSAAHFAPAAVHAALPAVHFSPVAAHAAIPTAQPATPAAQPAALAAGPPTSAAQPAASAQPTTRTVWVRRHVEIRLAGRQLFSSVHGTLIKDYRLLP
jgi:hypothetical protein